MWNPGASLCLSYFFTTFVFFAMYTTLYTYLWKMNMELPSPPLFQTRKLRIHYRLYYQLFSYYCNFRKHIWIHIRSYSTTGIKYCEPHPPKLQYSDADKNIFYFIYVLLPTTTLENTLCMKESWTFFDCTKNPNLIFILL